MEGLEYIKSPLNLKIDFKSLEYEFVFNKLVNDLEDKYMVSMFKEAQELKILVYEVEELIDNNQELEGLYEVDDPGTRKNLNFKFHNSLVFNKIELVKNKIGKVVKKWNNYYYSKRCENLLSFDISNDTIYEYLFHVRIYNLYKRYSDLRSLCIKLEGKWMFDSYGSLCLEEGERDERKD